MTNAELKLFYEKLYFIEVESRDKIQARLQIPLTLLLAVLGVVVFLIQNFDHSVAAWTAPRVTFVFFLCFGTIILIVGMVSFVMALTSLKFLPSSSVIILSDYAFAVSDDVGFLTTR